jgi:exopolysaccharide biosynthesis predicted pyruvyltransferase EpsI
MQILRAPEFDMDNAWSSIEPKTGEEETRNYSSLISVAEIFTRCCHCGCLLTDFIFLLKHFKRVVLTDYAENKSISLPDTSES